MDTAVSNPPSAMGQGDGQAIHPFFHQASNNSQPNSSGSQPDLTNPFIFPPPRNQKDEQQNRPIDPTGDMAEGYKTREYMPSSSEEDLNASRRKRRKTEKTKNTGHEASLRAGLSEWLGKEIPAPAGTPTGTQSNETSTPLVPFTQDENPPSSAVIPEDETREQDIVPSIDSTNPRRKIVKLNVNGRLLSSPPTSPLDTPPIEATNPERKILKLNLNGRLLSSPPASPPESAVQSQPKKRGRPRKAQQKIVSLKYNLDQERNIGQSIDDILNGKTRYVASKDVSVSIPKSISSQANVKPQPAKPTHPFFVKKQPPKPQADAGNNPISTDRTTETKTPAIFQRPIPSSSLFDRPKNKFPELVHPLWPPKDFGNSECFGDEPNTSSATPPGDFNLKKSKIPLVSVRDDENAMLESTSLARTAAKIDLAKKRDFRPTLRLPQKHAASGRVLQKAIDRQISTSTLHQPNPAPSHPSISKSQSELPSYLSAFDCGKYESQLWAHKYAPKAAEDVLQIGQESHILRDWLQHLKINAVDTGKSSHDNKKAKAKKEKKKNRRKADKLDGFVVSSEEEASEMENLSGSDDELAGDVTVSAPRTVVRSGDGVQRSSDKVHVTNAILLTGPSGCGKTASVYAVAKELDFEIFEISPGSRRSARDMLEKVGDMTQNHLVHLLNDADEPSSKPRGSAMGEEPKQNKLMGFFKGQSSQKPKTETQAEISNESDKDPKRPREQKQSLILLEEADILFEEDKNFWTGVMTLISQSRRPIVLTCNDESLIPTQDMSLHAILRYQRPPPNLAIDYLLLVAAKEGHLLKRDAVTHLYNGSGHDLRRSLNDLNFWCQVGVGSEKAGLDWILPLWPPEDNVDQDGDRMRVLSLNTYEAFMGWFNRDLFLTETPLEKEIEALRNTYHWWRLGLQDLEDANGLGRAEITPSDQFASKSNLEKLEALNRQADYSDSRSSLDMLCSGFSLDSDNDVLDTSIPPMLEAHRSNYTDDFPLLQSDLRAEYSSLSQEINITTAALLSRHFRTPSDNVECSSTNQLFSGWTKAAMQRQVYPSDKAGFQKVFGPIMRARHYTSTGRLAPSFESSLSTITEDLAPYIRGIMTFDGRLKAYRDHLYAIWAAEQGNGDKRARTTRASRAALEGSDKAFTRRERWFPDETNYFFVQGTGSPDWQNVLYQMGHFHAQPAVEAPSSGEDMDQCTT